MKIAHVNDRYQITKSCPMEAPLGASHEHCINPPYPVTLAVKFKGKKQKEKQKKDTCSLLLPVENVHFEYIYIYIIIFRILINYISFELEPGWIAKFWYHPNTGTLFKEKKE